jgi:hypothetical protein
MERGECSVDLDDIVTKLNERKQRATYGAVAGILGVLPRGLMAGRQRNHKYSWVVAATRSRRGWPTGYTDELIHPDCLRQIRDRLDNLIEDSASLRRWLSS